MSPRHRRALRIFLPFAASMMVGILFSLAFGSWLGLISVLAGFPLGIAIAMTGAWRTRRKKMRTARPQLESLLDAMIAMVEQANVPLEKIVFINESDRQKDGALTHRLSLHGETLYSSETTTDRKGRMRVNASRHWRRNAEKMQRADYPDLTGFAKPEPWLTERLQKLRTLVGDVSGHQAMKKRLKEFGIDLDAPEEEETPCGS